MNRMSRREVAVDLATGVYRAVIDMDRFGDLLDLWEDHVSSAGENRAELIELIEKQVTRTQPLLADFIRDMQTSDVMIQSILREGSPCALVSRNRMVLAVNAPGRRMLHIEPGQIFDTARLPPAERKAFDRFMRSLGASDGVEGPLIFSLDEQSAERRLIALTECRLPGSPIAYGRITMLDLAVPGRAYAILASAFNLTPSELDTVKAIIDGKGGAEVARERGVREDTVKKQIKAIRAKTGASGPVELMRMVASLARFATDPERAPEYPAVTNFAGVTYTLPLGHRLASIGERRIEYYTAGPADGFPLLVLHGLITGIMLEGQLIEALERQNLRIVVPLRPGYGLSEKLNGRNQPDPVADHLAAFAHAIGLRRYGLLSITTGAFFGLALQNRFPDRVAGHVITDGYLPVSREELDRYMPPFTRTMYGSTIDYPKAARFMATCGYRVALQKGPLAFFRAFFRSMLREKGMDESAMVQDSLARGLPVAAAQGLDTYLEETRLVAEAMAPWAAGLREPVTVLHGTQDAIYPLKLAQCFRDRAPAARLVELPHRGLLACYRHPDRVADAVIASLRGRSAGLLSLAGGR